MNKVILIGRLTRDPEARYATNERGEQTCICRYTLACDRRGQKDKADFVSCVAFGKSGEFAEKYLKKGTKICVTGRIQTGSYTNKDGQKVYTTDVVVEEHEFCESKNQAAAAPAAATVQQQEISFIDIPDGIEDDLPFN